MSPKSVDLKQGLKEQFGAREPEKKPIQPRPANQKKAVHHSTHSDHRGTHTYYLPADTAPLVTPLLGLETQHIDNFALLLNKCAFYDTAQEKFIPFRKKGKDLPGYHLTPKFDQEGLHAIRQRHAAAVRALHLVGTEQPLTLNVDWRLIVGLGNESVYETSLTLHHIYGIPYIPGQAVKGVLRSWLIREHFHADENNALQEKWFCDIFGCPAERAYKEARQGSVYFFDAFPTQLNKDSIQPDIMNPHYAPYYAEKKPPADYHNPLPVTFLTVQNTTFEFLCGISNDDNKTIATGKFAGTTPLQIVHDELKHALLQHGLGAKTAVGYGYFRASQE